MIFDNKKCVECHLRDTLCKCLSDNEFEALASYSRLYVYKKGDVILDQDTKCFELVYLTKGVVKFVLNNDGRELIVAVDKAQTLIGLANILNEDINYFSVIALTDCNGCAINLSKFKMLMMNNKSFMFEVMSLSTQMFRGAINNFISVARKQSNGRVADVLIYLSDKIYNSRKFVLDLSRQELADFAGCSKEQIIHTLRNLNNDNIIKVSGKNIEILDFEKLATISKVG
ncbi:MAG: Crp/Fnr family transcriptional regulator [Bacteroidales bacterium]|nr:Crp/Fnr family transcriptional regulator [Bacteroidales bacterium]